MTEACIQVTQHDFERLEKLLDGWWAADARMRPLFARLEAELGRARVVDSGDVEPDCITLGSEVELRDLDENRVSVHRLVLPNQARRSHGALSILSSIGISALGYRVGDDFECQTPGGTRRLRVERILYQPESAARLEGEQASRSWHARSERAPSAESGPASSMI